jgi:hypothetical protein
MDYITVVISIANVVAILFTYFLNRRDEFWVRIMTQKNAEINNLESELNRLQNTNGEMTLINSAFAKMFADKKH